MKKFQNLDIGWKRAGMKRKVCRMQLIIGLLFGGMMIVNASSLAQCKVSMSLENASLQEIFREITRLTGYDFVYSNTFIQQVGRQQVKVTGMELDKLLQLCLEKTNLGYKIEDSYIIISPKLKVSVSDRKVIPVKGTVVDVHGYPLPGVTVVLKGSSLGVITDEKGNFRLEVPEMEDLRLVFSFVGMKSKELPVKESMKVVLEEETLEIDEVVVNGFYTANKKTYTGAATTIQKEELRQISTTNIFSVLQTLDPSFRVMENLEQGSNPNVMPGFELRGAGSITALKNQFDGDPNMPLFMVDGFEMSLEKVYDLDPMRIENITILKDASATAIYGSRAANGIVVIELTRPEKGKLKVDYSLRYLLTAPDLTSYHLLDARDKFRLEEKAGVIQPLTEEYNEKLKNVMMGYDTYWLNKPLKVGNDAAHALNISGGDEYVTYSLYLNYNPNKGVMIGSDRKRFSVGSRLTYRVSRVNISNSLNYDDTKGYNSPYGSFSTYASLNPYYKIKDEDGKYLYTLEKGVYNPLWNTTLKQVDMDGYNLFSDNLEVRWDINNSLRLTASGAVNIRNGQTEQFYSALHTRFGSTADLTERGSYKATDSRSVNWQGNLYLAYTQSFGFHYLTLNAGGNFANSNDRTHGFSAQGFMDENLSDPSFANAYSKSEKPLGSSSKSRTAGVFLNVNYTYNNIYFADVSVRADISSRFGKNSRWAPFWSAGLGYNIHNEKYMQGVEWVDLLRLRGSLGVTGSQNYDPYQAMSKYFYLSNQFYNEFSIAAVMQGLGNPDLKWQQSYKKNIGLDLEFLNKRFLLTLNYYSTTSKDLLTPVTLPPSLGFTSYMENLGEARNTGFEFTLRATLVRYKDLNLAVHVNGARNRNKLLKISNALTAWNKDVDRQTIEAKDVKPKIRFVEGQSMNTIWVVRSLGIDPANGKEMFLDKNGNRTYIWSADDQVAYTSSDPDLDGSVGINVNWKGLSVSAYANYSLGAMAYNNTLVAKVENVNYKDNCDRRVFEDRWQNPGDRTFFKDVNDREATKPTSRFVQKNNFLRMSSLNVSYQFSEKFLHKTGFLKSLRLGFNTNDLFYLSTLEMERGLEYPFARTYNFSLQISL